MYVCIAISDLAPNFLNKRDNIQAGGCICRIYSRVYDTNVDYYTTQTIKTC